MLTKPNPYEFQCRIAFLSSFWFGHSVSKALQGVICGRTSTNAMINFPGTLDLVGQTVDVRVTRGFTHSCRGEIVAP